MRSKSKRKTLYSLFKRDKYDIICLQESHITEDVATLWEKEWGGRLLYSKGTANSLGQMILIRKGMEGKINVIHNLDRILSVSVEVNDELLAVTNIYAPNTDKDKVIFFHELTDCLMQIDIDRKIVCGDFNSVLSNEHDIISGEKHSRNVVQSFQDLLANFDFLDTWRMFHGDTKEFSWCRRNPFTARRLDYILTSPSIFDKVCQCEIKSIAMSDHRACHIDIVFTELCRGPGYYKFNNSLLRDQEFVEKMNCLIASHCEHLENDLQLQWELLKLEIKKISINYSKIKSVERKNQVIELQNELNMLDIQLSQNPSCHEVQNKREKLKLKLEVIEQHNSRAAQIRSRVKWVEEGEKNTKYFLNLEKTKANSKIFCSLKEQSGKVVTNQQEILRCQYNYFSTLYKKKVCSDMMEDKITNFLNHTSVPTLSQSQKESCEGLLTHTEILEALKDMNNGSAPGLDGLTIEFLKMFWSSLCDLLTRSFNQAFQSGCLSKSQRKAAITLIYKGNDLPRNELGSWRPISLTNSDYKLFAKCLAARLKNVIDSIILGDQVGYLKGRRISTLLRTIDDVIEQMNVLDKPGLLVTIDYSKAFDNISKEFMLTAFKLFGFGPDFLNWVRVLMANSVSCISYSGWQSEFFDVSSGIRQGCPFSPLAFILAIEILAIRIRNSSGIKGLQHWCHNGQLENVIKIFLYADDITLFLLDEKDLRHSLLIINLFSKVSGLTLNTRKSEAMWIGSKKHSKETPCGFTFKTRLKILGIIYSSNLCASLIEDNWNNRLQAIKRIIGRWEKRNLSIVGKICICKTFLLSQFVYVMQALILPEKVLVELNRILYRFIWRKTDCNKRAYEKVKRSVLCLRYENGGLTMIDAKTMQLSFALHWVVGFCKAQSVNEKWSLIPQHLFSQFGNRGYPIYSRVKSSNFKGLEQLQSHFWKKVLIAWLDNNSTESTIYTSSSLWNNSNVKYSGNVLYYPNWIKGNLMSVQDMIEQNEVVSFQTVRAKLPDSPGLYLEYIVVRNAVVTFLNKFTTFNSLSDIKTPPFCNKTPTTVKEFRVIINGKETVRPSSVAFWERKFNIEFNKSVWSIAYLATKETRLRVLQWKLLQNIYPTNIMLNRMKVTTDNKCELCPHEVDFIEHFFYECPNVLEFWKEIENLLYLEFNVKNRLRVTDVLFGITHMPEISKSTLNRINHILLIGKMSISIWKKTKSHAKLFNIFENSLRVRKI